MQSWWNVKLVKRIVGEAYSWWNINLVKMSTQSLKCQVGEMSIWQDVKLAKCQVGKTAVWLNDLALKKILNFVPRTWQATRTCRRCSPIVGATMEPLRRIRILFARWSGVYTGDYSAAFCRQQCDLKDSILKSRCKAIWSLNVWQPYWKKFTPKLRIYRF